MCVSAGVKVEENVKSLLPEPWGIIQDFKMETKYAWSSSILSELMGKNFRHGHILDPWKGLLDTAKLPSCLL